MLSRLKQALSYIRMPGQTQNAMLATVMLICAVLFLTNDHTSPPDQRNQILGALRNAVFDTYQQLWPRETQWETVRIVDIDEESLEKLGQWPWSRRTMAQIVDNLSAANAGVIGFDIVFSEPDRISPQACMLMGEPGDEEGYLKQVFGEMPSNEDVFAEAIARAGNVVLGVAPTNAELTVTQQFPKHGPITQGGDPSSLLIGWSGVVHNLKQLEDEALRIGSFASKTQDGTVRSLPVTTYLLPEDEDSAGHYYPALGFAMWSARFALLHPALGTYRILTRADRETGVATGITGYLPTSPQAFGENDPYLLETDQNGEVRLHFARIGNPASPGDAAYHKLYLPAWKVAEGDFDPEQVAGRFVLIGASAQALHDIRATPVEGLRPGMEVHAQFIDSLYAEMFDDDGNLNPYTRKAFLSRGEQSLIFEILALFVSGIALVVLVPRLGPVYNMLLIWVLVGGFLGLSIYQFREASELIDPSFFSIATMTMFTGLLYGNWRAEQSQKKFIRDAFSQYLSPNLVEVLAENPEMLALGGEYKEVSIIFTDIASFTTFTEQTEPEIAVSALNDYLTGMLEIVMEMEGTIDKIIGDAVVVLFNAPLDQPDHHARAIECALRMDQFAEAYKAKVNAAGVTLFGHTRIGVHCGRVLVGNFGGEKHFDYTCHGDAMNTAARLESLNKHLGTRICVSAEIAQHAPELKLEPIGTLVLKGKTEGIDVLRPLTERDYTSKWSVRYRDLFTQMDAEDEDAQSEVKQTLQDLHTKNPHHPLITLHNTRYQNGETGSRIVMTEK
ncbi:MAG: adenylate/guanylate cyclase domain-containing protein [Alphaproteobacteria bacterium]